MFNSSMDKDTFLIVTAIVLFLGFSTRFSFLVVSTSMSYFIFFINQ